MNAIPRYSTGRRTVKQCVFIQNIFGEHQSSLTARGLGWILFNNRKKSSPPYVVVSGYVETSLAIFLLLLEL